MDSSCFEIVDLAGGWRKRLLATDELWGILSMLSTIETSVVACNGGGASTSVATYDDNGIRIGFPIININRGSMKFSGLGFNF